MYDIIKIHPSTLYIPKYMYIHVTGDSTTSLTILYMIVCSYVTLKEAQDSGARLLSPQISTCEYRIFKQKIHYTVPTMGF